MVSGRLTSVWALWVAVALCARPCPAGSEATSGLPEQLDALWEMHPRPVVIVPHIADPKIDGTVSDEEKAQASVLGGFYAASNATLPAAPQTTVYLGWAESGLYVAFSNEEQDTANLFVQGLPGEAHLYWDDSNEVFLDPEGKVQNGYVFMVNTEARKCDGKLRGPKPESMTHTYGFDREWNAEWEAKTRVVAGKRWEAELLFPWKPPFDKPVPGATWCVDLHRMRYASARFGKGQTSSYEGVCGPTMRLVRSVQMCFVEKGRITEAGFHVPYLGKNRAVVKADGLSRKKASFSVTAAKLDGTPRRLAEGRVDLAGDGSISYVLPDEGVSAVSIEVTQGGRSIFRRTYFADVAPVLAEGMALKSRLERLCRLATEGSLLRADFEKRLAELTALLAEATEYQKRAAADFTEAAERRNTWEALYEKVRRYDADLGYCIWTKSPWIASPRDDCPPQLKDVQLLQVKAAVNEYEPAVLVVTNFTEEVLDVLVSGSASLPGLKEVRTPIFSDMGTVVRNNPKALGVEEERGFALPGSTGEPLLPVTGDPLEIVVPPLSSRLIWLTFLTRGMTPGRYAGRLTFEPLNKPFSGKSIPVELTVWDFELPKQAALGVHCYNYQSSPSVMEDLVEHKVNHFFTADFGSFRLVNGKFVHDLDDARRRVANSMKYGKPAWAYGACVNFYNWAQQQKLDPGSPQFKQYWQEAVRSWAAMCKELGLDYKDYSVGVWDEVKGKDVDIAIEMLRMAKEVEPRMRWANTIQCSPEEMQRFVPYLDLWVFGWAGAARDEAFRKLRKERGAELWVYRCSTPVKAQPPLGYYRYFGWRAIYNDLDGITFFSHAYLVYQKGDTIITLRPWEAYREGIEDWQYIHLCRQLIDAARADSQRAALAKECEEVLNDAIAKVLEHGEFPPNTQEISDVLYAQRERIAGVIVKLRGPK